MKMKILRNKKFILLLRRAYTAGMLHDLSQDFPARQFNQFLKEEKLIKEKLNSRFKFFNRIKNKIKFYRFMKSF